MSTILKQPVTPYPLATKSKEVIPHELAAPAGCYKISIQAGASYVLSNPPRTPVVAVVSGVPILVVFTNEGAPAVVEGQLISGGMICPPGTTVVGRPRDQNNIVLFNESDEATTIYVQLLHSWNVLGTDVQTTRI